MIYFSAYEILIAVISFFALGCLFGGIYNSFVYFFDFFKKLISLPKSSYLKYKKRLFMKIKIEQNKGNGFVIQLVDFSFVITFGIVFILFSYIFLDGTFRFFSFLFTGIGYVISLKLFDSFFSTVISRLMNFLLGVLGTTVFILLYPVFCFFEIIKRLISPIIAILSEKYNYLRFKHLLRVKTLAIEKNLAKKY